MIKRLEPGFSGNFFFLFVMMAGYAQDDFSSFAGSGWIRYLNYSWEPLFNGGGFYPMVLTAISRLL